jgi:hypothetical protein
MVLRRRLPRKALTLHVPHRALTPDEALNMIRTVNPRADASFGLTFQCIPAPEHSRDKRTKIDGHCHCGQITSKRRSIPRHSPSATAPTAKRSLARRFAQISRAGRAFCSPQRHAEELCEDSRKRQ